MRQSLLLGVAASLLASAGVVGAVATNGQLKRIREAATVLHEIHQAPDRDIPGDLWDKASCVAVIPSMSKVAFIIGGEYGKGVMSCRVGNAWSAPSFIRIEKGSVGLQIGGETVDLVLLVMNDKGVNHLLQDKVALGGEASIAGGPVGRDARAMTDGQMKAEILSYSRAQGLFAGLDLTGGVLKPDRDDNRDFYGRTVEAREILMTNRVSVPKAAAPFLEALRRVVSSGEISRH